MSDAKARKEIMEVKTYLDYDGREVKEFIQTFGQDKEPNFYKGRVVIKAQIAGPNGMPTMQALPFEFMFPEGISLKKAFETFDDIAKQELDIHTY